MKNNTKKYTKISLGILFALLCGIFLFDFFSHNPQNEGLFVISRGDNILQVASSLHREGYIGSRIGFVLTAIRLGESRKIKVGRYQILKGTTNMELLDDFVKFKSVPVNVMITPGKNIDDISRILSHQYVANRNDFLGLVLQSNENEDFYTALLEKYSFLEDKPIGSGLEGFLFPDSYLVDSNASSQDVINQMLDNFDKKLTLEMRQEIKRQKKSVYDVIITASILEKEVQTIEDKKIVAGIIWKRINNNYPIEIDSTSAYQQKLANQSIGSYADMELQYDTYARVGLPIGPICNPGLDSIMGALYPKDTDYWFYLSAPDGETVYSKTLGEHLIQKAKYLTL